MCVCVLLLYTNILFVHTYKEFIIHIIRNYYNEKYILFYYINHI